MHIEGVPNAGFGWNWFGWNPKDAGHDISSYNSLVFALRIDGTAKPASVRVQVKSNDNQGTAEVDLLPLHPTLCDGTWHEIAVPLEQLRAGGKLDATKAWELVFAVSAPAAMTCDVSIDEVGFSKAAK